MGRLSQSRVNDWFLECPDHPFREVAILKIQGKEFSIEPLPLRTVRPFVMDEMVLSDVAEAGLVDLSDRMAITKLLKDRVRLIVTTL